MSLYDRIAGSGFTKLYSRTVGGIQVLYAAFFGWLAFLCLRWTTQQLTWIAQQGFDFQGSMGKGEYVPALDVENLAEGTVFALLSLCCLIGGVGLLQLRSWARRLAIAYLIVVAAYSLDARHRGQEGPRRRVYRPFFDRLDSALPAPPFDLATAGKDSSVRQGDESQAGCGRSGWLLDPARIGRANVLFFVTGPSALMNLVDCTS